MRLFIGIPVPEQVADSLHDVARRVLPEARLVPTENMHVTLVFLGEVEEARVAAIAEELSAVQRSALTLRVEGLGSFPGSAIANIAANGGLSSLAAEVSQCMSRCGFPAEKRPYRPHITLARSRQKIFRFPPHAPVVAEFVADSFVLCRSWLDPRGARYEHLRRFELNTQSGA